MMMRTKKERRKRRERGTKKLFVITLPDKHSFFVGNCDIFIILS
jgi:hypothetical protein